MSHVHYRSKFDLLRFLCLYVNNCSTKTEEKMQTLVERVVKLGNIIAEGQEALKELTQQGEEAEKVALEDVIQDGLNSFKTLLGELYKNGARYERIQVPISVLPLDPLFRQRLITRGIANLQTLWMIENGELKTIAPGGSDPSNYPFDSERNRDALALIGVTLR